MKKRLLTPAGATAATVIAAGVLLSGCGHAVSPAGQPATHVSSSPSIGPGGPIQLAPPTSKNVKQAINGPVTAGAQGRTLTVRAVAAGCTTVKLASQESASSVTLTVTATKNQKRGEMCSTLARLVPVQTTLKAPLGSRRIIDGSTGRRLPAPK